MCNEITSGICNFKDVLAANQPWTLGLKARISDGLIVDTSEIIFFSNDF